MKIKKLLVGCPTFTELVEARREGKVIEVTLHEKHQKARLLLETKVEVDKRKNHEGDYVEHFEARVVGPSPLGKMVKTVEVFISSFTGHGFLSSV